MNEKQLSAVRKGAEEMSAAQQAWIAHKLNLKMAWKEKTCESCRFRTGLLCRRFPPQFMVRDGLTEAASYPAVVRYDNGPAGDASYEPACAEHEEDNTNGR
jgi:hypothetical protein